MARSRWKFCYFDKFVWKLILIRDLAKKIKLSYSTEHYRMFSRSSQIPRCFYNITLYIHGGRKFLPLEVGRHHIGSRIGEYAYTRKIFYYPMRKKIKPRK